jgi:molecular chaperone DnaJ
MAVKEEGNGVPGKGGSYYEILGVPRDATDRVIKYAYRLLARKLHPDVCNESGAEERFKEINEAYRVLSNHEKRRRYDTMGHEEYRRSQAGSRDVCGSHAPSEFQGFGDIFDLFFSERSWGSGSDFRQRSVSDILVRVQITLEEAILGTEKVIEVPYASRCPSCKGTGSTTGKVHSCPRCGGSGKENTGVLRDPPGPDSPCGECGGKGRVPEVPCALCGGWGATQATRRVAVRIPPGIDSGMRIRREGLGESVDQEIPTGDLYVEVTILPHPRFTRVRDDLEVAIHLSPARAALGSTAEVDAIKGRSIRVDIPPGVQHDTAIRVKGEGVKVRDRSGDLVVRVKIDIPEKITARERDLYRSLLEIEGRGEGRRRMSLISRYLTKRRDTER